MNNQSYIFAKALIAVLKGKDLEEQKQMIKNFVGLLKEKGKINLLGQIQKEVEKHFKKDEVVLTFSREIDIKAIDGVKEKIKGILGKEKTFKIKIDKDIVAGFTAKDNNYLIDASIKGLLKNIKNKV